MTDDVPFSLAALNLLAAICDGDRRLGDLSSAFRALGYRLHEIEPTIVGAARMLKPDAVACSTTEGQTLLTEFTALTPPDDRKARQAGAYEAATPDQLTAYGVPPGAAAYVDAWWLVPPEAAPAYTNIVGESLVSAFCPHSGRLLYGSGAIGADATRQLLQRDWTIRHLPMSLAAVSLDARSAAALARPVIQHLVSAFAKGDTGVSCERLAHRIWPRAWHLLSNEAKAELTKAVDGAVGRIAQVHRPALLRKVRRPVVGWQVPDGVDPGAIATRLRRDAGTIEAKLCHGAYQDSLFTDEEV